MGRKTTTPRFAVPAHPRHGLIAWAVVVLFAFGAGGAPPGREIGSAGAGGDQDFGMAIPKGLTRAVPYPENNPPTPEKIALGRKLFFDPVLSADGTVSCATCHVPELGFASAEPVAIGVGDRRGRRNAPTVINRGFGASQFWDGRAGSLEEQALLPIASKIEMGSSIEAALERLGGDDVYRGLFEGAFEDGLTAVNLARAIGSYERSLMLGDSGVDKFRSGQRGTLSLAARQGMWLFESRGRCWQCHAGPLFSDEAFHNTGVSWGEEPLDTGRHEVTGEESDRGAFKTPTLRGLTLTAPYMHDGSVGTLEEVVRFYADGGGANPNLDPLIAPVEMSEADVANLVAFLEALGEGAGQVDAGRGEPPGAGNRDGKSK